MYLDVVAASGGFLGDGDLLGDGALLAVAVGELGLLLDGVEDAALVHLGVLDGQRVEEELAAADPSLLREAMLDRKKKYEFYSFLSLFVML